MVAIADSFAATSYEEARNQRVEENKRKFQDLGISSISKTLSHLTASPNKTQHRISKPKARNAGLDIEPRRSSRQRNPVQTYCDNVGIDLPSFRKRSRSSSSFCGSYLARPMEEVRLCSWEERTAAIKAAEKLEENLQTENPSFVKTMVRSHVYSCFWLGLPTRFCDEHLSKTGSDMVLEDEHGNEYDAVYIGSRTGLSGGWRAFALEHKLDDGDALVFELTEPTRFKVYIVKVSPVSSPKHCKNNEDIPRVERTPKAAVKPDSDPNQMRRSKRGAVPEKDDSQPSPNSESNQKRRSKRGIAPAMDDTKASPDLGSNQIRRSKRGIKPATDDLETSPKLPPDSPKGCETEQEVCAMKMDEVAPKQVTKKAKANRVRFTERPEGCEVKSEETEEKPQVPEKKPQVTGKKPEVEEKNARATDENECVAKKPRRKVVKQRLFRKRA